MTPGSLFRALTMIALFTAVSAGGGCQAINGYLADMPKPTAEVTGAHLADLSIDSANLVFDVNVHNPYTVALPLADLDYTLASGGKPFLSGQAPVQGEIPAKGSKTLPLAARLDFARAISALSGVQPGAVIPYDAELKLSVNAPGIGKVTLPLKQSGQLPVPAIPGIELADVQWKGLDLNRAQAVLHVHVVNTNQFSLDVKHLSLELRLAGHTIASTAVDQPITLAPNQGGMLEIPIVFSPKDLGLSAFQILQGKGSKYKITGLIEAGTPFGALKLPYEKTGDTSFKSQ